MTDFAPLNRAPSLASRVSDALLEAIASGQLRVGDRLPSERALSDQFGVSRTVIRETVRGLEAKGVLAPLGARGMVIAAVPSSRLVEAFDLYVRGAQSQELMGPEDLAEVRRTLELRLAALAAERATPDDLRAMTEALESMATAGPGLMAAQYDTEFHRAIARATHNPLYVTLNEALNGSLQTIRLTALSISERLTATIHEHRSILRAIQNGDAEGAANAMEEHLSVSRGFYK